MNALPKTYRRYKLEKKSAHKTHAAVNESSTLNCFLVFLPKKFITAIKKKLWS